MKNFLWILDSSFGRYLQKSGGLSTSYIMPGNLAPNEVISLAGTRLWVLLRAPMGDSLFGVLHIELVEKFEDGMNAGDLCLTVTLSKSYICSADVDYSRKMFGASFTRSYIAGVHDVDSDTLGKLSEIISRNVSVKFQKPSRKNLNKISGVILKGTLDHRARRLMAATTLALRLGEVWGTVGKAKMPPFANFAFQWLKETDIKEATTEMATLLSELDPTILDISQKLFSGKTETENKTLPVVDANMQPVDPDKIIARTFLARDPAVIDYSYALKKTERAEKRHQDMLKELVIQLSLIGLHSFQSTSIDLFLQFPQYCCILELKTATTENFLSQCSKGLFQLGCYEYALRQEGYENIRSALIIETTGVSRLDAYASKILHSFDVMVFHYYPERPWPQKVSGASGLFEDILVGLKK